jgi:hypothetical protein
VLQRTGEPAAAPASAALDPAAVRVVAERGAAYTMGDHVMLGGRSDPFTGGVGDDVGRFLVTWIARHRLILRMTIEWARYRPPRPNRRGDRTRGAIDCVLAAVGPQGPAKLCCQRK